MSDDLTASDTGRGKTDLLFSEDTGKTFVTPLPAGTKLQWSVDAGRSWQEYVPGALARGELSFLYSCDAGKTWSATPPAAVRLLYSGDGGSTWRLAGGPPTDSPLPSSPEH